MTEQPQTSAQVAAEVARRIRTNPRRHDQANWFWFKSHPEKLEITPQVSYGASYERSPVAVIDVSEIGACGTTACVAGYVALVVTPGTQYVSICELFSADHEVLGCPYEIAKSALRLSTDEAEWLFCEDRTRRQILGSLDRMADGKRAR